MVCIYSKYLYIYIYIYRSLDAFKICSFGEARVYTNPNVSDQYIYLRKTQFFSLDAYADADHRKYGKYLPGFKFVDIPGATLKVVGILRRRAPLETIEDTIKFPQCIANTFFNKVLNAAISCLPIVTRTRQNNLSLSSRGHLPTYYRLYPEDIPVLSNEIKQALKSLPRDDQFTFYFVYMKFGQQQCIIPPLTISSLNLDMVIADVHKIEYSCCHIAVNFHHSSGDYSVFWHATEIAIFLRGKRVVKYPFMGLSEIGNVSSSFPRELELKNAWPRQSRDDIHLTHAQAYTPLIKPMDTSTPFHDHPFLISFLLGREYVKTHKEFQHIVECTEGKKEYSALREAIILKLSRAVARYDATCPIDMSECW